jgi:hypothetical protein
MDSNIPFRAGTNTGMGAGHVMSHGHFSDFEECMHILVYAPLTVTVPCYNLCLEISTQLCVKTFHSATARIMLPVTLLRALEGWTRLARLCLC